MREYYITLNNVLIFLTDNVANSHVLGIAHKKISSSNLTDIEKETMAVVCNKFLAKNGRGSFYQGS